MEVAVFFFNKGTFHPDIKVSSIYLHDTRNGLHQVVNEGQFRMVFTGRHLPCTIPKAAAQR